MTDKPLAQPFYKILPKERKKFIPGKYLAMCRIKNRRRFFEKILVLLVVQKQKMTYLCRRKTKLVR